MMVFDVDGVMTDGRLLVTEQGEQLRTVHIRDGYALRQAVEKGYLVAALSGGQSEGMVRRLKQLGLTQVYTGVDDKGIFLRGLVESAHLDASALMYMGDDLPDLPALRLAGMPVCPLDATAEVRAICRYVSPLGGGAGCVRDVIEKVLKLNGQWNEAG